MEGIIFWIVAGLVLGLLIRRTKRKAKEVEANNAPGAKPSAKRIEEENNQTAKSAISSSQWKKRAKKAKARAGKNAPNSSAEPIRDRYSVDSDYADALSFAYTDSQGNSSIRDIINWHFDGKYLKGFCIEQEDVRTFRRDRIDYFLHGEEQLDDAPLSAPFDPTDKRLFDREMEILFTGFAAEKRAELEDTATDVGIVVRRTVTQNLTYLCAGPRAGATKLRQAQERGAVILDESQFYMLLETGEIPA